MRTIPREVDFVLNKIQTSVLIGTLLGDGGVNYRGKECRLHIKHSANQLPLVNYKRKVFSNITRMKVRKFTQKVGEKDYIFAEFVTFTNSEFTKYRKLFYPSGKKVIPKNIKQLLIDPLSLAVWFMDDGSAEYAGASLQTHCFTETEVKQLMSCLKLNFKIKTTKRLNKGKWIIYFPKDSLPDLKRIIGNKILKEFEYKLKPYSKRKKSTP